MTLPLYVQGCSRERSIKRESIRTEQKPIRTHQEATRNQLEPRKNQPGSACSFQGVIFHGFACTSRSIIFTYLTRMKEDFILLIWGVCHLERTPWLLVPIFISLSRQRGTELKLPPKNCFIKICSGVGRRLTICHMFLPTSKYASEIKNRHNDFESSHIFV